MVRVNANVSLHMRAPYIATVALLAGTSCTYPDEAHLYNNSGSVVTVRACGIEKQLLQGETFKLQSPFCADPLLLSSPSTAWTYKLSPLRWSKYDDAASEYAMQTEIGYYVVRFQLNAGGAIVVVPAKAQMPVVSNIPQPHGFPKTPDAGAS
jgi:hypothetical protein